MQAKQFDWDFGEVIFWDLVFLDPLKPLSEQVEDLKEDLAQVKYGDQVLDIGWYPEFSPEGAFVVKVVCGTNWDKPMFQESRRTIEGLIQCLKAAITVAKSARLPPITECKRS